MDRKTQIIAALESHYTAEMDRETLEINNAIAGHGSLKEIILSIERYSSALNQLNLVQKLKSQLLENNEG